MLKEQNHVTPPAPHLLTLSDRSLLSLTGVEDVGNFDETMVSIYTTQGELTVRGTGLHIQRLSIESGDMTLEGHLDSLTYTDIHKGAGGLFGKLFR